MLCTINLQKAAHPRACVRVFALRLWVGGYEHVRACARSVCVYI